MGNYIGKLTQYTLDSTGIVNKYHVFFLSVVLLPDFGDTNECGVAMEFFVNILLIPCELEKKKQRTFIFTH